MAGKQTGTFPFDFISVWIVPVVEEERCTYCQEGAAYDMHQFTDMRDILTKGMDAAWMKAIRQQVTGNYKSAYRHPVCMEHAIHFASIALGKQRPIQQLLAAGSALQKQQGMGISLVIVATVRSFSDEGDLWAVNAPSTKIEEVVRHIRTVKRP